MRSIGPAVTRKQSPAFLRNSNGRWDLPGPLNARASYTFNLQHGNQIECQFAVNNILDLNYRTTAWCGTYYDPSTGDISTDRGYFQQPGRNYMLRAVYRF